MGSPPTLGSLFELLVRQGDLKDALAKY